MQTQFDSTPTKKKTPCNGCRERKRKCSYEQPCARCAKSGTECIYTVMPSPKDLEYMKELAYMDQIDQLQRQISSMESEISILKLAKEHNAYQQNYPSPTSSSNGDIVHSNKEPQKPWLPLSPPSSPPQLSIVHTKQIQATISKTDEKSDKPWRLTVQNGNMTIETNIKSHSELMACVSGMLTTAIYQQQTKAVPFPFSTCPVQFKDATTHVMSVLVWRKYGKSRFKSITKFTPFLLHDASHNETARFIPANQLDGIIRRILDGYFGCMHLQHFCLYRPAFIEMFVTGKESLVRSPAVLALCAVLCHHHCKHLQQILMPESMAGYGLFFFEQARELIEDRFDEPSMETLITYTFLSLYLMKTNTDNKDQIYINHAIRIRDILLPQYGWKKQYNETNVPNEVMMLDRLDNCIRNLSSMIEFRTMTDYRKRDRKIQPMRIFELIDNYDIGPSHVGPDDSPLERQALRMYRHLAELRGNIKQAVSTVSGTDLPSYIGLFGHHIEMAMRYWYRNLLPKEFQLSLPLFDDTIPDLEFFSTLEVECGQDPFPLISLLTLYNEYLVMAKSYVPKSPLNRDIDTEELIRTSKDVIYSTEHGLEGRVEENILNSKRYEWLKHFILKIEHFRRFHQEYFTLDELEETSEEFMTRLIRALKLPQVDFNMPVVHIAIGAALNSMRLTQFFLTREYSCYLDLRWVMNAWDILLRAARFRYQQPNDPSVTLDRIRANLLLCLDVVRHHGQLDQKDPSGEFIGQLEDQFNQSFTYA